MPVKCQNNIECNNNFDIIPFHNKAKIISSNIFIDYLYQGHIACQNTRNKTVTLNGNMKLGQIKHDFNSTQDCPNIIHNINHINLKDVKQLRNEHFSPMAFEVSHLYKELQNKILTILGDKLNDFFLNLTRHSNKHLWFNLNHDYPIEQNPHKIQNNLQDFVKQDIYKIY